MYISSIAKVVAALALIGSLSFPAYAVQFQQDLCGIVIEGEPFVECREESSSVPEPGVLGLLGLGLAGIAIARRRK